MLTKLLDITLDPSVAWRSAISYGDGYYAAGYRDPLDVVVVRGNWSGDKQYCDLGRLRSDQRIVSRRITEPLIIALAGEHSDQLWVHVPHCWPFNPNQLVATDAFPSVRIGAPSWLQQSTLAFERSESVYVWSAHETDEGLVISTYTGEILTRSRSLPPSVFRFEEYDIPSLTPQQFCVRSGCVFIGNEDRLIILQNDDKPEIIKIRGRIRSIISLGSNSSDPIAVATMQGVDVVWKPNFSPHVESVVSNFAEPKLGVTANQRLLVANQQQIDLFQVNREGTHIIWQATYSLPKTPPLAILTVNNWDQIAMLFYGGTLHHYQLPMNSVAYAMADE